MTCKENCLYYEVCSQFSKADGANCKYYDFSNQAENSERGNNGFGSSGR